MKVDKKTLTAIVERVFSDRRCVPKPSVAMVERISALDPATAEDALAKGCCQGTLGEFETSIATFDQGRTLPSSDSAIVSYMLAERAEVLAACGRHGDAAAVYASLTADTRVSRRALVGQGACFVELGQLDKAEACFKAAIPQGAGRGAGESVAEACFRLSNCLAARGAPVPDIANALKQGNVVDADFSKRFYHVACNLLRADRYQGAVRYFDLAILALPVANAAMEYKADCLSELGQHDDALQCINRALALAPQPSLWSTKAMILALHPVAFADAMACADEALRLEPDSSFLWNRRGIVCYWLGQDEEALACYEKSLGYDGSFMVAQANMAEVLYLLGRYSAGDACAQRVISADRKDAWGWSFRALNLSGLEDHEAAVTCAERAVRLRRFRPDMHGQLAEVLLRAGRHQEAIDACDAALKIQGHHFWAHYIRARACQALGLQEALLESCRTMRGTVVPRYAEEVQWAMQQVVQLDPQPAPAPDPGGATS